ncbi:MAG: hypothetical protein MI919_06975, partial [Holophagales bacterium]|nr:hypothetical protein [Holophagales bacterium]
RLRRTLFLAILLAFVTTATITVTAETREPRPEVRNRIVQLLPAPRAVDEVPVNCLASSESPLCDTARQLVEQPPCTRAADCRAFDQWRQIAGEPSLRLAPLRALPPAGELGPRELRGRIGTPLHLVPAPSLELVAPGESGDAETAVDLGESPGGGAPEPTPDPR